MIRYSNKKHIIVFILLSNFLYACNQLPYNTIKGEWIQNATEMSLRNSLTGKKYIYDDPGALYSQKITQSQLHQLNADNNNPNIDDYTRDILSDVGFNKKTDTVYFSFDGYLIVYSSPDMKINKAASFINLKSSPEKIKNYSFTPIDFFSAKAFSKKDCIFQNAYLRKKEKQYIIRYVYRIQDHYMNWVYIFQSKTNNIPYYITLRDLTNPLNIMTLDYLTRPSRIITLRNARQEYSDICKQ